MFENIIGHDDVAARLRAEVAEGRLPSAVLFHGPRYTGKTTMALELARAVSCEEQGAWNCRCRACRQQRSLVHPYTLLLGTHYFLEEITVAAESLVGSPSRGTRFLFLRAVRKLLRRFDEVLWQSQEQRISSVSGDVREVSERLEELDSRRELPDTARLAKLTEELRKKAGKIASALPRDPVSTQAVRNVSHWSRTSGPMKVVILDGADRLNDGARNALLKTLEEPAPEVLFVLLAETKSAVMPTILSRLRQYEFKRRPRELQQEVIRRVFRSDQVEYASLREYFLTHGFAGAVSIPSLAEAFYEAVVTPDAADAAERLARIEESLQGMPDTEGFRYFFEELAERARRILRRDVADEGPRIAEMETVEKWRDLIADAALRVGTLNMNPTAVCESLYYAMRQVDAGVH